MNVYSTGTNLSKHPFWHQVKRLLDPVVELLVVGYEGGGGSKTPRGREEMWIGNREGSQGSELWLVRKAKGTGLLTINVVV